MIQSYLQTRYEDGARGPGAFDCWGMVRDVLLRHASVPAEHIPAFGHIHPDDKRGMTRAQQQIVALFTPSTNPVLYAIGCHVRRRVLVHVGIVVQSGDELRILHTSRQWGPACDTLARFERLGPTEYFCHVG